MDNNSTTEQPIIEEYKGNAILKLNPSAKFSFSFGLGKARLILEHIEAIRAFVESEGKSVE